MIDSKFENSYVKKVNVIQNMMVAEKTEKPRNLLKNNL